jgi:beta-lactam-binding protein with PASTA domain
MDDNNNFLSGYNKREDDTPPANKNLPGPEAPREVSVKSAKTSGYKYEQTSGFKLPERKESSAAGAGGQNKKLIIGIAAGGGALLLIVLILILVLSGGTEVINLVGRTLTEAQLWASDNGLRLQATETYSDEAAAGTIISQETPAGTRANKNDFVYVTVSLGPDLSVTLPLPDLMNMTKDEVDAWAAANFMTKVRVTAEFNATVPVGNVIRYEINDNTVVGNEVRRDTPIYVIVSKGIDTTVEQIEVPDFKTMTLSESYVFANSNGLVLAVEQKHDDYVPEGSIISQSVKAKEKVPVGTEIKLVASLGKMIEIPDFSDYTKELATSVAAELGIPVTIIEKYSGSSAGRFISQSLPAGTVYEKGDYLELYYSLGNKIVVPSFVGQTRDAIENWALDLNERGARINISVTTTNSSSPAGTIIHQSPANTTVGVSKTIKITVSKGAVVYVPDFKFGAKAGYDVAITREQAIAMCEELKLVPVFKEENSAGVLPGAIWYQSESPGKEVPEGTKITLKFAKVATAILESCYGMSESEVRTKYNKTFKLVFEMADEYVDSVGEGRVVSQSINVNTRVPYGTTLTLYLNPSP